MHYYPHHIGDFIKDTANLNDHQMATYLRMIWTYYTEEQPLPDDCDGIAFAMRSDEKTVHLLLRHYFDLQADGWHQKRCDQHIEHFHSNSEKGRKAAVARWSKNKQKMPNECIGNADARRKKDSSKEQTQCKRNANAMHMHTKTDANAMVFDSNQQPTTNKDKTTLSGRPDEVQTAVWQAWLDVRKAKRAAKPSDIAMDAIKREAGKAGMELNDVLTLCVERNWVSFQAAWISNDRAVHLSATDDKFLGAI